MCYFVNISKKIGVKCEKKIKKNFIPNFEGGIFVLN